jgi:tRNA/rRNA methyltransferase
MRLGEKLQVVLHQTQSPDNLGAVARVMANFGLSSLTLSEPVTQDFEAARKMAVHSHVVLERMQVVGSLEEALSDVVYAVGTTSREALRGRQAIEPEEAVRRLAEHAQRGRVALVFGGERRGLSDEELARCQDALVIPTSEVQPSMNLAQAAAVLLYLCSRADVTEQTPPPPPGAPLRLVQALEGWMQQVLLEVDVLNPRGPGELVNEMVQALQRARLTPREAQLWLTAFKQLARRLVSPQVPPSPPARGPG